MSESNEVDKLLSILGEGSSEPKPTFNNEIEKFIHEYNLKKSLDRTPNYVIWYTYKDKFKGDMSKIGFFRTLSKYFEKSRTGKQKYYNISGNFDVSYEGKTRAKYFNKER